MKEFIYKDRYESTLNDLLIWWGTLFPPTEYNHNPNELVCDFGGGKTYLPYGLEGVGCTMPRLLDAQIGVKFCDYANGTSTLMEPGDRIIFNPKANIIKLVRS